MMFIFLEFFPKKEKRKELTMSGVSYQIANLLEKVSFFINMHKQTGIWIRVHPH